MPLPLMTVRPPLPPTPPRASIVELGEKLYSGDLKKADNGDNFGRPGSTWTYKSTEIGKYADGADGEWTRQGHQQGPV